MSLSNIKKMKDEQGFTIVELLIVIVVIGILAAIVIVAYNGVQNSAKTQSARASAAVVQKKLESYNASTGNYPSATAYTTATTGMTDVLNADTSASLAGSGLTLGTPTAANGQKTVGIYRCSAGGTGYSVVWWDYSAGTPGVVTAANGIKVNNSGTCTTWTELT